MMEIRESILPGIGMKYQMDTASGDRIVIVIHDDGRRELYHFSQEDYDQSRLMATFEDQEARQFAALVGGMVYKPKQLESVEMAFDDLTIEWYRIEPHFGCIGKTIGELHIRQNSGASVIALIDKNKGKQVNPGPDAMLRADATVVAVGEREQQKRFKQILMNGSG